MTDHKQANVSPPFLPGSNTLKMLDERDIGKMTNSKIAKTPFERSQQHFMSQPSPVLNGI